MHINHIIVENHGKSDFDICLKNVIETNYSFKSFPGFQVRSFCSAFRHLNFNNFIKTLSEWCRLVIGIVAWTVVYLYADYKQLTLTSLCTMSH